RSSRSRAGEGPGAGQSSRVAVGTRRPGCRLGFGAARGGVAAGVSREFSGPGRSPGKNRRRIGCAGKLLTRAGAGTGPPAVERSGRLGTASGSGIGEASSHLSTKSGTRKEYRDGS